MPVQESEISVQNGLSLKTVPGRLVDTIHSTAIHGATGKWGSAETETGVCRLALTDLDKNVRDWFVEETKSLGCNVKIDELGNIFAIYPGKKDGPPTAIGSHLDTQPTGGRYDGILGVLAGLEVLRTIHENGHVPEYPICVIDWCNEEGARFPVSMMASSVYSGSAQLETIYNLKSVDDSAVTVRGELERIGYLGDIPCLYQANPIAAHFELHIEQGPILEQEKKKIGLVSGIQALKWTEMVILGKAQHSGTTPFSARTDALLTTSKILAKGDEIARKHGGLWTVGVLDLQPRAVNVIPNEVKFIYDIRHHDDDKMAQMSAEIDQEIENITSAARTPVTKKSLLVDLKAVHFDKTMKNCIQLAAEDLFGKENCLPIVSGASHDSGLTAKVCPTAMIFVPSKDGVSHNFEEYTSPEEVEEGFHVLLRAVLLYDRQRS